MTLDAYVQTVANTMPEQMPEREQIAADVRAHIDERVQHGDSPDAILAALGDPARLAERYLAEIGLTPAPFWPRAVAKLIDMGVIVVGMVLILCGVQAARVTSGNILVPYVWPVGLLLVPVYAVVVLVLYAFLGEARHGQTPGKHVMHLVVIREAGTRISAGQAIVRQLPWFFQIFWIDAAFALFTDKNQRAFELLSKTRTVLATARSTNVGAAHYAEAR